MFIISTLLLLFACGIVSPDPKSSARIISGKSIEEVEIGDSIGKVMQNFSQPKFAISENFNTYYSFFLNDTLPIASVITTMRINPESVTNISIYGAYSGTTADGIGIGSTRSDALNSIGQPDTTMCGYVGCSDYYGFGHTEFVINYIGTDTVFSIVMRAN